MRAFYALAGLAGLVVAGSANASPGVVFDTITGQTSTGSLRILTIQNHAPMGEVFSAPSTENISSVTVQLLDGGPSGPISDLGSVLMYLVPDSSGVPAHSGTTLGGPPVFLGSILDSSLLGGDVINNIAVNTNTKVTAGTYWIELTSGSDPNNFHGTVNPIPTSAAWSEETSAAAILANAPGLVTSSGGFYQSYTSPNNTDIVGGTLDTDVFMMQIKTQIPEPTSLVLLGSGLIGLGLNRRRRSKKALS